MKKKNLALKNSLTLSASGSWRTIPEGKRDHTERGEGEPWQSSLAGSPHADSQKYDETSFCITFLHGCLFLLNPGIKTGSICFLTTCISLLSVCYEGDHMFLTHKTILDWWVGPLGILEPLADSSLLSFPVHSSLVGAPYPSLQMFHPSCKFCGGSRKIVLFHHDNDI